ncbi:methyl-accepting chemotaxis protein [alpha proteobacterium U9-1i]|nr:methyl-accepting chemotaxis protein [alpha proteobacterium U9-1i]
MKHQDALDLLAQETARARRGLALERTLRIGLPVLLAIGVWAALALAGVHDLLPWMAQSLTAIAALAVFAWLTWRAQRTYQAPTEAEARARLAVDSKLDIAAFESLRDRPSRYDAFSVALWSREREHAIARAEYARAGPPRPQLDQIDPYKLRYVLIAALLTAAILAGGNGSDRLARAFLPDPGPLLGDQPMQIEAWVTPADYTHAAPISLSDRLGQRVETPPTVEATVRLTGPVGAPVLVFDGPRGQRRERFTLAADGAWEAQMTLPGPGRLRIVRFHTRAQWRMAPSPDAAPEAAFTAPLAQMAAENVAVAWRAADDFGVTRLALRVRPTDPPESLAQAPAIDTAVESPAGDPRSAEGESELDLADHPYAGMEVEAQIVAFDALGQEGASTPLRFTLPEKVFLQPLAQAAIEIRRHILTERRPYQRAQRRNWPSIPAGAILLGNERIEVRDYERQPSLRRAPDGIRQAARLLDALTMAPRDGYFRDMAVFLGFRMARAELDTAQSIGDTDDAADMLWRTALRAEYGGAADTRRAMEEAQRALAEALAAGAPPERIRQLVEALEQATERYMQALIQEALRNGESESAEDTEEQASVSERDIQEMLREVQRLSEQGRNAEAQQLLQQLSQILNNMDAQLSESQDGEGQEGQEGQQNPQMQQSMDELSQAIGEQRALNDETQRQNDSGGGSGGENEGGQGGGEQLAEQQAQIRESLGQAQQQASEAGAAPSDDLNAAQRAMQQAENALARGDLDAAESAQAAALESLREGAEQLATQMREQGRRAESGQSGEASGPRDPLGRLAPSGGVGEGDTSIPTQIDPVRAREILDEIRRRAQDASRPESEREYLRRLLDRFGGDS